MQESGQQNLADAMYRQREAQRRHYTYDEELLQYAMMRDGDPGAVEESISIFRSDGNGKLSADPVRDTKYRFVASITLATRFAIEGGMDSREAYNLSDLHIQKMDACLTVEAVYACHAEMIRDFTARMAAIRSRLRREGRPAVSQPVAAAVDYIYYHLHDRITVQDAADAAQVSPNYLNNLFRIELGQSVQGYIRFKKIEAAQNMLRYSNATLTEIALTLAFSSESHFVKVFHEQTGFTPKAYRSQFFQTHERWGTDDGSVEK